MPKKVSKDKQLSEQILLRLSPEQLATVEKLSKLLNLSRANIIRTMFDLGVKAHFAKSV
jgi:hypothetical protein